MLFSPFLFALVDNAVAGMAVLYIYKRFGYFAGASSLPAYQGIVDYVKETTTWQLMRVTSTA